MFASLTKSISSLTKGPRAILSESIAHALSEHFELDPAAIESSLLKDAKIVLKNTRLKQKCYRSDDAPNAVVNVEGLVGEVVFSWRWSLTGSSGSSTTAAVTVNNSGNSKPKAYANAGGMVQDAKLTIKGLRVKVTLQAWDGLTAEEQERLIVDALQEGIATQANVTAEDSKKATTAAASADDGYMQRYIQNVVDHLTLQLEDFEFVIQVKDNGKHVSDQSNNTGNDNVNGPAIVISGNDLELGTMASAKNVQTQSQSQKIKASTTLLSQLLSIETFSITVQESAANRYNIEYPLIEPFGYAASVTRLSGKRFQGGLLSGLDIVGLLQGGQELENPGTTVGASADTGDAKKAEVRLHIGKEQMRVLCKIGALLAPASAVASATTTTTATAVQASESQISASGTPVPLYQHPETPSPLPADILSPKSENETQINDATTAAATTTNSSTTLHLPLPSLTLVLPASDEYTFPTNITLPSTNITYRTDGTVSRIESLEGIKDNGVDLIGFGNLNGNDDNGGDVGGGGGGARWVLDFVKKRFEIQRKPDLDDADVNDDANADDDIAMVTLRDESLRRILSSVAVITSSDDLSALQGVWEEHFEDSDAMVGLGPKKGGSMGDIGGISGESDSWSISTKGRIVLRMESTNSGNDTVGGAAQKSISYVEAKVEQLDAVLSTGTTANSGYALSELVGGGIQMRPSFGDSENIFTVPSFTLRSDILEMTDPVQASLGSVNDAVELKNFFLGFAIIAKDSISTEGTAAATATAIESSSADVTDEEMVALPFTVKAQGAKFYMKEKDTRLELENMQLEGNQISIDNISCSDGSGMAFASKENKMTLLKSYSSLEVCLGEVESCKIPDVVSIVSPLKMVNLSVTDGTLGIRTKLVHLSMPMIQQEKGATATATTTGVKEAASSSPETGLAIHGNVNVNVDQILLEMYESSSLDGMGKIEANSVDLNLSLLPDSTVELKTLKNVDVKFKKEKEWIEGTLGAINASISDYQNPLESLNFQCNSFGITSSTFGGVGKIEATTVIEMNVSLSPDSSLKIEIPKKIGIKFEKENDWVNGILGATKATVLNVSDPLNSLDLQCSGVGVKSSSFGRTKMRVFPITFSGSKESSNEKPVLVVKDATIIIERIEAPSQLIDFFGTFTGEGSNTSSPKEISSLPFSIQVQSLKGSCVDASITVAAGPIVGDTDKVHCQFVNCKGPNNAVCMMKDIEIALEPAIKLVIGQVDKMHIPKVVCLAESLPNLKIRFADNMLQLEADSIQAILLKSNPVDGNDSAADVTSGGGFDVDLPFPVSVVVKQAHLFSSEEKHSVLRVSDISMSMSSEDNMLNVDTKETLRARLSRGSDWVDCSILPSFLALSAKTSTVPYAMNCGGMTCGPCSAGILQIKVPSFTLLPESECINVNGNLDMKLETSSLFEKIEDVVSEFVQTDANPTEQAPVDGSQLTISVHIPNFIAKVKEPRVNLAGQNLTMNASSVSCASLDLREASGMAAMMHDIQTTLGSNISVMIKKLSKASLPGVATLSEPTTGITIDYREGCLYTSFDNIKCTASPALANAQEGQVSNRGTNTDLVLPFPTQLKMNSFVIQDSQARCLVSLHNIDLRAKQVESAIMLNIRKDAKFKAAKSSQQWMEGTMGSLSVSLVRKDGQMLPTQLDLSGGVIGPCSPLCGELFVNIPRIRQDALTGDTMTFTENIKVQAKSFDGDTAENLRSLIESATRLFIQDESPTTAVPFPIQLPGLTLLALEPKTRIEIEGVSALDSTVLCKKMNANANGLSCSLLGIEANIKSHVLNVNTLEHAFVPGVMGLSRSVSNIILKYQNNTLCVEVPSPVNANVVSNDKSTTTASTRTGNQTQSNGSASINVPFPIHGVFSQIVIMSNMVAEKKTETVLQEVSFRVTPKIMASQDLLDVEAKKGIHVSFAIGAIRNDLFQTNKIRASFVNPSHDYTMLKELQVFLDEAQVTAGFSSIDWSSILEGGGASTSAPMVFKTPFAKIKSFHLSISYKGKVLSSKSKMEVPSYAGSFATTSDDLKANYSNVVLKRIPGFLANTEVLGSNAVDSALQKSAVLAMGRNSLAGAGTGSVTGVVLADGIRGAIAAGKKDRNASADDGYKFGDFTRGTLRGIREASKKGAQMRGDSEYIPGDMTAGAISSVGEYASNNKSKLGSAGASGVGSMVGLAVAGPLGFVAGSYLAGKAAKSAIGEDKPKEKAPEPAPQAHRSVHQNVSTNTNGLDPYVRRQQQQQNNTQTTHQTADSSYGDSYSVRSRSMHNAYNQPHQSQQSQIPRNQAIQKQHQQQHYQQYPTPNFDQPPHQPPQYQESPQQHQARGYPAQHAQQMQQQRSFHPQQCQARGYPRQDVQQQQQAVHPRQYQTQGYPAQHAQQQQRAVHPQQYQAQGYPAQHAQQHQQAVCPQYPQQQQSQQQQQGGYQFGDFTKSIVAKGKRADGRDEKAGYKFGDFTRGLFK